MNWMLSDTKIREALKLALKDGQLYGDNGQPIPEKAIAIAQKQKIVEWLEGECPHNLALIPGGIIKRHMCPNCWAKFSAE